MFQKIEEQRKEIEQRNSTLLAIQRNFESLSLLCKNEKNMNQELQRKVAFYMEENGVLIDKVKTLQEKNKILMEEIAAKDKEIVSLRDRSEKMSVFSDKIKRLEEELDKRNKIINQNQRDMNELALENKNLKESLRETERNAGKVVGTLEEMRKEINMKTLETNEKRNMIEVLQDDFKDLGREKEFLDVKCTSLEVKIEGLTNELKTKNNDIFQLKEKNRRLEEKESIFIQSKLNGEEVFRQENERLRKFMKEKDDEIRKLEEKHSFLTNDKTKLESIIDELKKVREKNNDDLSILNEKLKEGEILNKGFENKIREMEGKIQSLEIEKRNSGLDIDNLKKKIRETEEINYKHQREINDRNLNEVRKTEELEKLRGKCEYFQKKTIESNEKLTKSDELLAEKMKEITNLKEEAVFLNRKLMDLTIEKEDILKNMENLDKNREGFIEEYKKSIQKNQMLQKEIDLISGERDSFLSQLKDKQSLMSENQNLSRSLEMFKQQEAFMKEKDQIIKEKDYNLKEKEANIQKSEIVIKQLKNENKSFEDKIFELEALIKKLNPEKLEQMKKSIETRESSLKNVIAKLENAEVFLKILLIPIDFYRNH